MNHISHSKLLFALLKTDLFLLRKTLLNKWIDLTTWVITTAAVMEGMRESVMGNQQFFSFIYTCIIIVIFTAICFAYAYKKLQRTLDFI